MKNFLALATAALLLASCDDHVRTTRTVYTDDQPAYATPAQPVYGGGGATVIHDNDNSGALMNGLILGHMLSNSGSSNNSGGGYSGGSRKKTVTINKTYNTYQAPARSVSRPSYSAPSRSSYRPSAIRSSSSMGSRAVRRR